MSAAAAQHDVNEINELISKAEVKLLQLRAKPVPAGFASYLNGFRQDLHQMRVTLDHQLQATLPDLIIEENKRNEDTKKAGDALFDLLARKGQHSVGVVAIPDVEKKA